MNKKYLILLLIMLLCFLGLIVVELIFVNHLHSHFSYEKFPGFYGVLGFVAFIVLVFGAKYLLRPLVSRPEDYIENFFKNDSDE